MKDKGRVGRKILVPTLIFPGEFLNCDNDNEEMFWRSLMMCLFDVKFCNWYFRGEIWKHANGVFFLGNTPSGYGPATTY